MHELAFTEGVIKLVASEAQKQGFTKCLGITLAVGKFSGIVPECIIEFFPYASKDTIAENAKLTFVEGADDFKSYVDSLEVE